MFGRISDGIAWSNEDLKFIGFYELDRFSQACLFVKVDLVKV